MRSSSIIIFGILSAIVLILSCITLNAPTFYNELEMSTKPQLVVKPSCILRERN